MQRQIAPTLVLLWVLAACAWPQAEAATPDLESLQRFRKEQLELRSLVQGDARYAHVDDSTKRRLVELQDDAFSRIDALEAGTAPVEQELAALEQDRDAIARLTRDIELDRPRCRNAPRTGSRLRETTCMSAREREAARAEAQAVLGKSRGCRGSECGSD